MKKAKTVQRFDVTPSHVFEMIGQQTEDFFTDMHDGFGCKGIDVSLLILIEKVSQDRGMEAAEHLLAVAQDMLNGLKKHSRIRSKRR